MVMPDYRINAGYTPLSDWDKWYTVSAWCDNCGKTVSISVRKGKTKPKCVKCPNCGCVTLKT